MKKIAIAAMSAAIASCALCGDGWTELFNGKNLDGWKVIGGEAKFHVEDGCIVGVGVPSLIGINTFLATDKEFSDFDLRVEFLCESGNSGIQFRSSDRECEYAPRRKVFGYQAEITPGGGCVGRIYDEERRGYRHGIVWLDFNTPAERQKAVTDSFKKGDWNEMRILCQGARIRTWVNGNPVADILDDFDKKGFVGLQVHVQKPAPDGKDNPMRVRFRNIRIREMDSSSLAVSAAVIDSATAAKVFAKEGGNELTEILQDGRRVLRLNGIEIFDSARKQEKSAEEGGAK